MHRLPPPVQFFRENHEQTPPRFSGQIGNHFIFKVNSKETKAMMYNNWSNGKDVQINDESYGSDNRICLLRYLVPEQSECLEEITAVLVKKKAYNLKGYQPSFWRCCLKLMENPEKWRNSHWLWQGLHWNWSQNEVGQCRWQQPVPSRKLSVFCA